MITGEANEVHSPPDEFDVANLGEFKQEFYAASEMLDSNSRKSLFWSIRLMMETDGGFNLSSQLYGYRFTAYGFFRNIFGDDQFGVIVYLSSKWYFLNKIIGILRAIINKSQKKYIKVDGYLFKIAYRHIKILKHGNIPNPVNGTGACYATVKSGSNTLDGILTVKHVVNSQNSSSTYLSCGCVGSVIATGPGSIDAAIIQNCRLIYPYHFCKEIQPLQYVAQNIPVTFDGSESGGVATTIRQITDTRGIYNHPSLPIAIFLSDSGRPGDSGALVEDTNGNPIGLYIGAYRCVENKEHGGLAQHLYQVKKIMNLKLYK